MATAAVAKQTSNRTKFLSYANETGTPVTTENFYSWDKDFNDSDEQKILEATYGKEAIYRIGVLELFRRRLYAVSFVIEKGTPVLPKGTPRATDVRSGFVTSNITESQREFMQEKSAQGITNAVRLGKLWGLTPARIQKLVQAGL